MALACGATPDPDPRLCARMYGSGTPTGHRGEGVRGLRQAAFWPPFGHIGAVAASMTRRQPANAPVNVFSVVSL